MMVADAGVVECIERLSDATHIKVLNLCHLSLSSRLYTESINNLTSVIKETSGHCDLTRKDGIGVFVSPLKIQTSAANAVRILLTDSRDAMFASIDFVLDRSYFRRMPWPRQELGDLVDLINQEVTNIMRHSRKDLTIYKLQKL